MDKPLVSIVVPIYNVERYLPDCIESLTAQTYSNIEILLIDDGSTDSSGTLCDKYAQLDSRVRVIHQPNGGLSAARNAGTAAAAGAYITYVDGDDIITPDMVDILMSALVQHGAQMSVGMLQWLTETEEMASSVQTNPEVRVFSSRQALELMLYQNVLENGACAKIIKTEIAKKSLFPEGRLYEDLAVVHEWFFNAEPIVCTYQYVYGYIQHGASIMHREFSEKSLQLKLSADEMEAFVAENCPELLPAAKARKFSAYSQLLRWIPNDTTSEIARGAERELWQWLCGYRWKMMLDNKARRKNRIAAAATLLGKTIFKKL